MVRRMLLVYTICLLLFPPVIGAQDVKTPVQGASGHFLDSAVIDVAKVLPAPPEPGSLAGQADLEAVRMAQAWRGPEQVAWAKEAEAEEPFAFAEVLGPWFKAKDLPLCARFLEDVTRDVKAVSDRAKGLYQRKRPYQVDEGVKPCVMRPFSASYPSGHSTRAFARALTLGEIFPEQRNALLDRAHRAAWGRILGGVHFPSDDVGGRLLAEAVVAEMKKNPAFREAVTACRKEAEAHMTKTVAVNP